jgi:hypothetical protein
MFETARLVETLDEFPREEAESELPVLRLLVAAESDGELCVPAELVVGEPPREFAKLFELAPPRAADADPEFADPLRPKYGEAVVPRLPADAEEPLLKPRAEFAPDAPKRALEGGVAPARLPAL